MVAPISGKFCDCRRTRPCRRASWSACVTDSEASISATISPVFVGRLSAVCATMRPRTAVFVFVLVLARRPAAAAGTAAIGRQDRLAGAFAIAIAVGVAARRIGPEVGRRPGGNARIDARHHSGVDGRNPRLDVEVGRAHDALRLNRRATEIRKWQNRNGQGQRRALCLHPPTGTIVDHETSVYALWRRHRAPYCAGTARLTVFSLCSLLIRPATSSFVIALLPNCNWNRPPCAPSTIEAW